MSYGDFDWDPAAIDAFLEQFPPLTDGINPIDFNFDDGPIDDLDSGSWAQGGDAPEVSSYGENPMPFAVPENSRVARFPQDELGNPIYSFADGTQVYDQKVGWFWPAPKPRHLDTALVGPTLVPLVDHARDQRKRAPSEEAAAPEPTRKKKKTTGGARVQKRTSDPTYPCICATSPKIPRPLNSWIIFRREQGPAQKKLHPNASTPELSKILGEIWASASTQTKARYTELAKEEFRKHTEKYPNYKYDPSRGHRKKFGVQGKCQCGAYERNTMYKMLRRDGMQPPEAMARVEQRFNNTPVIAAPGSSHAILQNRPNDQSQDDADSPFGDGPFVEAEEVDGITHLMFG